MVRAVMLAEERGLPLCEAERTVLDATHAEVGAYLLGLWGLPYPILEAVAFHHDPAPAAQTEFDLLAAVAVAQALVADSEPRPSGLRHRNASSPIDGRYLAALGAPFDWAEAARRVHESSTHEDRSDV
jgi:HD-like signal output (HDOD) protein